MLQTMWYLVFTDFKLLRFYCICYILTYLNRTHHIRSKMRGMKQSDWTA